MNKPTEPKIPEGLLERCLSTIPETATYRPAAPRLSPDAGSRVRLRWLSVAAAIPVVMVAAVLPIRRWLVARPRSQNLSRQGNFVTDAAKKKDYLCIKSWRNGFDTDFETISISPSTTLRRYSLKVMGRNSGIYDAHVNSDYKTLLKRTTSTEQMFLNHKGVAIDAWDTPRYGCSLQTPEGKIYRLIGHKIFRKEVGFLKNAGKRSWKSQYDDSLDSAILGILAAPQKYLKVEKAKLYDGNWKGTSVSVIEYSLRSDAPPAPNRIVFQHRIQFFVSKTDNLVLGKRDYMHVVGSKKEPLPEKKGYMRLVNATEEILVGEAEYSYAPSENETWHLDPKLFPSAFPVR